VRRVVEAESDVAVVDLRKTARIEDCAPALLARLVVDLGKVNKCFAVVATREHASLVRHLQEQVAEEGEQGRLRTFGDLDPALEWCEYVLLKREGVVAPTATTLGAHDFCRGFDDDTVGLLAGFLEPRRFPAGATIIRQGDIADEVFLLMSGTVSVTMDLPTGERRRLSSIAPGMVFGELTIVDRCARTADVHADTPVECLVLTTAELERLETTHPAIAIGIMRNLLRTVHRTVLRISGELAARSR